MTETTLSARVAEVERALADVTKERDALMRQVQRCIDERNGFLDRMNDAIQARIAAEAALATARVEGARAQREAFVKGAVYGYSKGGIPHMMPGNWEAEASRRYPVPSAHAGEARPECCRGLGRVRVKHDGVTTSVVDCPVCRPAPTPEPPRVQLTLAVWNGVESRNVEVDITPEDARAIVALGSRPTQTAEG